MNFEQLLEGATKGPWVIHGSSQRLGDTVFENQVWGHPYRVCLTESQNCTKKEADTNAEYIARCNPAVMREVWAALKEAEQELSEYVGAYSDPAKHKGTMQLRRALALLDGQTEKGGAE